MSKPQTNDEIIAYLHGMVDKLGAYFTSHDLEGVVAQVTIAFKADEQGNILRLTVGGEYVTDDEG